MQDGKLEPSHPDYQPLDRPVLGVARLADPNDKYLQLWTRVTNNPVVWQGGKGIAFPGQVWKNGDHWNFVGQGARFQTSDKTLHTWTRMDVGGHPFVGMGENGGQWWLPVPNQADGSPPPAGTPNRIVNVGGGDRYLFGNYNPQNETFTPWSPTNEKPGREAHLENNPRGPRAGWFGAGNPNGRMMLIGWALGDYHGPAGPGINFLTRLTGLREVTYDAKLQNLVANPLPEMVGLRTGSLASETGVALTPKAPHAVKGTENGAASSADVNITFSGITGSTPAVFGVCVLASSANEGMGITVTVIPPAGPRGRMASVQVGPCVTNATANGGPTVELFDDSELTVRILADRSVADFFVQGGRWATTASWLSKTPRAAGDSNVVLWATTPGVTADIHVYGMGCGWVDPSYTTNPNM